MFCFYWYKISPVNISSFLGELNVFLIFYVVVVAVVVVVVVVVVVILVKIGATKPNISSWFQTCMKKCMLDKKMGEKMHVGRNNGWKKACWMK